MELFMFIESGGAVDCIDIVPIVNNAPQRKDYSALGECSSETEQHDMVQVVAVGCGSVTSFNQRVDDIIDEALSRRDQQHSSRRTSRRLSATLQTYDQFNHMVHLFERYKPGYWWVRLFFLYIRLLSTAMMVFFLDQVTQV